MVIAQRKRYAIKGLLCEEDRAGFQIGSICDVRAFADYMLCDGCGEVGEEVRAILIHLAGVALLCGRGRRLRGIRCEARPSRKGGEILVVDTLQGELA
jgi:hypothetical protein